MSSLRCSCKHECGDVPEATDHPQAVCKGLPRHHEPLVEVVLTHRDDAVLGYCPHGVNLDREFCPEGCRV